MKDIKCSAVCVAFAVAVASASATASCAVKVNGRTMGLGEKAGETAGVRAKETAGAGKTVAAGLGQAVVAGRCRAPAGEQWVDQPPFLTAPADPWQGVDGDRPAALPVAYSSLTANVTARARGECDGAHDHCLRDCTWMIEHPGPGRRTRWLAAGHYQPDGTFARPEGARGNHADNADFVAAGYVAYRTVPATRRLLRAGVKVAVQDGATPDNEEAALGDWLMGTLDSVDWDAGTLMLAGSADTYQLSAARVVVLAYHDGGKVELLEGFDRDEIVVHPDEVIEPTH